MDWYSVRFSEIGFRFALYRIRKARCANIGFKADGGTSKSQLNLTASYDDLHGNKGYILTGDFICLESDFRNSQTRRYQEDNLATIDDVVAKAREFMKEANEEFNLSFDFYPTEVSDYVKLDFCDSNVEMLFRLEHLLSDDIASSEYMTFAKEADEGILDTLFRNCIEPALCRVYSDNTHKDNCAYWLAKEIDTGEIIRGYTDRIRKELDDLGILYKENK